MRTLLLIGIGAGDPDYVTMQAVKALNRVDVFFAMDKGEQKEELLALRREICTRYITKQSYRFVEIADPVRDPQIEDYAQRVRSWHEQRALRIEQSLLAELDEDQCGAFLVWGDPMLYDSTLRIIDQLRERANVPFQHEVVPGITAIQALTAKHKITLNGIGSAVHITTGRKLAQQLPQEAEDIVVMLDGEQAFLQVQADDLHIYWGAYLGTQSELLIEGPLADVKHEITRVRAEARARHGWIMDTYLLRKGAR